MEDSKIVELFYERSEQAIIELSRKYDRLCKKIAKNILGNSLDAEECVNDAYLGVWNTIPPQNPNPLITYVCKIVRNTAVKKYHNNTAIKRNAHYDVSLDELENCFCELNTAEDEYSLKLLSEEIDKFLDTLDKENRVIFIRRYWYADSVADIAKRLGYTEGKVKTVLFRMRKKLGEYIAGQGVAV